jgi:hypothetical protein
MGGSPRAEDDGSGRILRVNAGGASSGYQGGGGVRSVRRAVSAAARSRRLGQGQRVACPFMGRAGQKPGVARTPRPGA